MSEEKKSSCPSEQSINFMKKSKELLDFFEAFEAAREKLKRTNPELFNDKK